MFVRLALACLVAPFVAQAQDGEVRYAPAPSWVVAMHPREASENQKVKLF